VYRRGACFHYLHHPANIEERPLQDHQSASAIRFPRTCFRKKRWVVTKMWERGTPNTLVQNTHLRELSLAAQPLPRMRPPIIMRKFLAPLSFACSTKRSAVTIACSGRPCSHKTGARKAIGYWSK
jgi:hypothetical protein